MCKDDERPVRWALKDAHVSNNTDITGGLSHHSRCEVMEWKPRLSSEWEVKRWSQWVEKFHNCEGEERDLGSSLGFLEGASCMMGKKCLGRSFTKIELELRLFVLEKKTWLLWMTRVPAFNAYMWHQWSIHSGTTSELSSQEETWSTAGKRRD